MNLSPRLRPRFRSMVWVSGLKTPRVLVAVGVVASLLVSIDQRPARAAETTERISVSTTEEQLNQNSFLSAISADGRFVSFATGASNLTPPQDISREQFYLRDRTLGITERVSVNSAGIAGNMGVFYPESSISADGRFVAFASPATNLVIPDTNGQPDIFVRDRLTQTTEQISVGAAIGTQPNGGSGRPFISADGRYVAFVSLAANLVSGDTNGLLEAFVRDRVAGTTTQIPGSATNSSAASTLSMSSDGRYFAFSATNLSGPTQVLVHDLTTGLTTVASRDSSGNPGNGSSWYPSISADGRFVAFESVATNLVTGVGSASTFAYLHDLKTGGTMMVSVDSAGNPSNRPAFLPWVSGDGRYVTFMSKATNLRPNDLSDYQKAFVFDQVAMTTKSVNLNNSGEVCGYSGWLPRISSDARSMAFDVGWGEGRCVPEDTNDLFDVYLRTQFASPLPAGFEIPRVIPSMAREQTYGPGSTGIHGDKFAPPRSDPVVGATGAWVTSMIDLSLPGIGLPFGFERSYTSADDAAGPLGIGWTHSFAATLTVQASGDVLLRGEDGQRLLFTVQPDGSYRQPLGGRSTLTAIAGGYEVLRHDQVRYRFDSAGRLVRMEDRNANGLDIAYGASGHISTITDTVGRVITFSYNVDNLLSAVAVPDGRTVSYGYTSGHLTSVTDVRGGTTAFSYDGSGRLSDVYDANGSHVVHSIYNADGRVVEQTDARGDRSTFSWSPSAQLFVLTDARGGQWKDVYRGNVLVREIDPLGNATSYGYDANLNLSAVTDARGNTSSFAYDARRNLTEVTAPAPLSYRSTLTYDLANNLISAKDGRDNTTTFDYDSPGNLVTVTRPGGVITTIERDSSGRGLPVSVTDPRGKVTRLEYDASVNLTRVISPGGSITTYTHDGGGRVTSTVEPRGNQLGATPSDYRTLFAYDAAGNLLEMSDPLGNLTTFSYDAVGNLRTRRDPNNHTTSYAYDASNHLVTVTAADASETRYSYDSTGNLVTRTDAKSHVTAYGYDLAARLTSVNLPTNRLWKYEYDASGNRTRVVDAIGNSTPDPNDGTTTFTYDALNRLVGLDYGGGAPNVQLAYDAHSNRTSMTDGLGTETYAYDQLNRLNQVGRGAAQFNYSYDASSNLTRRTYPDATIVDLSYDDEGRMASATSSGSATTYAYDPSGNLTQTTLPTTNGYVETRAYDHAGRLTDVRNTKTATTLSSAMYTYDPAGNPTSIASAGVTETYAYDSLDRLTEVCFALSCPGAADPFIRYSYDQIGNRTSESRPNGSTTTYNYNAADQLVSRTGSAGTVNHSYDFNGNQTSSGTRTFAYDRANRLASTTDALTTDAYSYDGLGNRMQATTKLLGLLGASNNYTWDVNGTLPQLVAETDVTNALVRRYVYGNDLISMVSGGASHYYHYDGIGSVANVTSATGSTDWTYGYEPFGTTRTEVKNDPLAPDNTMKFTGEYQDPTGLYHLRARQYDPTTGRFLQTDPVPPQITDPYVAAYVYTNNRPTLFVDPSGMFAWKGFLQGVSLAASTVSTAAAVATMVCPVCVPISLTIGFAASGVSAGTSGIATIIECTDGGGFDFDCKASIAGTLINAVSFGAVKLASKGVSLGFSAASLVASMVPYLPQQSQPSGGRPSK